jgi:hypothetical protein
MIQRIQTIFLLLSGAAFAALLLYPFATSAPVAQLANHFFADGEYSIMDNLVLELMVLAGVLLAFVNIFLFRKRKTQVKIGYLLVILSILIPVVAYLYFTNQAVTLGESAIEDGPGIYLPIVSLVFALLANRFIRKDEKLVNSMDRLR